VPAFFLIAEDDFNKKDFCIADADQGE